MSVEGPLTVHRTHQRVPCSWVLWVAAQLALAGCGSDKVRRVGSFHSPSQCQGDCAPDASVDLAGNDGIVHEGKTTDGTASQPAGPYNVVVFMLDDLDVGSFDKLLVDDHLPNIKKYLIEPGTTFDQAFVTNSSCCPSRASFLTGQYCHNHGVHSVGGADGGYPAFAASGAQNRALPIWLHQAGYRTALIGKYMNSYDYHVTDDPFPTKRPLLQGNSPSWRKQFLVEHWYRRLAESSLPFVELPDYFALRTAAGSGLTSLQTYVEYYDDKNTYADQAVTGVEHYDLDTDPHQLTNQAWNPSYDRPRIHLSSVLNLLRTCKGPSCRKAEDVPPMSSSDACEVISAANVRVVYDRSGKPSGLKQSVYSGGRVWTRTGSASGSWSGPWRMSGHAQHWGTIGSTSGPGQDPLTHPSLETFDAVVYRPLHAENGTRTGVRQIYYKGGRYWFRDSADANGTKWPSTWSTRTVPAPRLPCVTGPYAAEIRQRVDANGSLKGYRQIFVDTDDNLTYQRDSLDVAGSQWPSTFTASPAVAAGINAISVYPLFDANGNVTAFRELLFVGSQQWSRTSTNVQGSSWPTTWTKRSLADVWGSQAQHPPTSNACD